MKYSKLKQPERWQVTGTQHLWRAAGFAALLIAAMLRFYHLALVPLHHDEGVNGYFLTVLVRSGYYHYDPSNFHGPTLYYLTLIPVTFCRFLFGGDGLSTNVIRAVPAFFGVATVGIILLLRRFLGSAGALGAALLVAVSPGAVYFSRDYIHETLFAFFALALVAGITFYGETSRKSYLMLAAASAGLLFATKETAIISVVVIVLAYLCTLTYAWLLSRMRRKVPDRRRTARNPSPREEPREAAQVWKEEWKTRWNCGAVPWTAALAIFVFTYAIFYSSFGTNIQRGLIDSVRTFVFWTRTGTADNVHGPATYLLWLWSEERAILVLGIVGLIFALSRGRNRFALFCAFWSVGMLCAYSLIPYKTPWLILNIMLPLAVLAGSGISETLEALRHSKIPQGRTAVVFVIGALLLFSTYKAVNLNFARYDDDSEPYVYAHTVRGVLALVERVNDIARINGKGSTLSGTVTANSYWPLPWYFRDYPNIGYQGKVVPTQEAIVIGETSQESQLLTLLGDGYVKVGSYTLRPGVDLELFARRELMLR